MMAKSYKRYPTIEEASAAASEKYGDIKSVMSKCFLSGVKWTLSECNKDRLPEPELNMRRLRYLTIGESISLPLCKWDSARSASSRLKKLYGAVFTVNKVHSDIEDRVIVTRIS